MKADKVPLSGRCEQAIRWQGFGSTALPVPIQREFLDWRSSPLAGAAEYLRARCQHEAELDLSQFIVVVPGGRAGRRLLEILVLTPPEIVTPEKFPELLYQAKWPFADTLTQQLAWTEALRSAPPPVLK